MIDKRIEFLIEKRNFKAIEKDLTRKMHVIVKAFGKPVVEQTVSYSSLPDFWEVDVPEILEAGGDDSVYLRGYYFDGLSRGVNLNIKLMFYDGRAAELITSYEGQRVYIEIEGELKSYVPGKWEEVLERFYGYASPVEAQKAAVAKEVESKKEKERTRSLIQAFKALWGY